MMKNRLEIAQALESWQKINLPELQKTLDVQSLQLFSTQTQSLESRKKLAEITKEFKKLQSPGMQDFKGLLKEYQNGTWACSLITLQEIDNINKRSKSAEIAFLNLYKVFADVPDPAIYFQAAMENEEKINQVQALADENKKLRDELDSSKSAISEGAAGLKLVKELQDKINTYENSMETMISDRVADLTTDLKADMDEKIKIYKETEYSLTRQLNQIKDQFTSLQSTQEFAKATSHTEHFDVNIAAKLAEIDILKMDFDNATSKVERLTRDNFMLKEQLKQANDDSKTHAILEEKQARIGGLEDLVQHLESKLLSISTSLEKEESDKSRQFQELEREIAKHVCQKFEVARLETVLVEYEDYESIKKELEIFKGLEVGEDADLEQDGKQIPLERVLLDKNKKLENEKTVLKMDCSHLNDELAKLQTIIETSQSQLASKASLISKMELDIQRLNDLQSRSVNSPEHLENLLSDFQVQPRAQQETAKQSDSSIVPILTSQRDRYKQRFEESHRNALELSSRLSNLQDQLSRVQQDNVSLYEKIKYQESFRGGWQQSTIVDMDSNRRNDNVSARYRDKYEESIDPFRAFKQEEHRRAQKLNAADRVAMQITKLLASNKYSRLVFVFYTGALHILVFVALFELMSVHSSPGGKPLYSAPNKPDT